MNRTAGRIMKARWPAPVVVSMSTSSQCGTSLPVAYSMMIVGESVVVDDAMVFGLGNLLTSTSGQKAMRVLPGEKPSFVAHGVGVTCLTGDGFHTGRVVGP